ncbi:uncharacterized protein EV422DRAFT_616729, partial [Fimicolochytrium jonesii]|uniref:uncharacterized protein n=1 Tax=Fimicolochytrium jonesii TaxID=1396493 RepID=UPI0022FF3468
MQTRTQTAELLCKAEDDRKDYVYCDIWNTAADKPCSKARVQRRRVEAKGIHRQFTLLSTDMRSWLGSSNGSFCLQAPTGDLPNTVKLYGCKTCMKAVRAERQHRVASARPSASDNEDGTLPPSGDSTPPPSSDAANLPLPTVRTQSHVDIRLPKRLMRPLQSKFQGVAPPDAEARRSRSRTTSGVLEGSSAKPWDKLEMLFFLRLTDEVEDEDEGDDRIDEPTTPGPEGRTYAAKLQMLMENPLVHKHGQLLFPIGNMERFIDHMNTTCVGLFDMKMTMVVGDVPLKRSSKWSEKHHDRIRRRVFIAILLDLSTRHLRANYLQCWMSTQLQLSNVSTDQQTKIARVGLSLVPQHNTVRAQAAIAAHEGDVSARLALPNTSAVVLVDDFNWHQGRGTPNERGKRSITRTTANVGVRTWDVSEMPRLPSGLGPLRPNFHTIGFAEDQHVPLQYCQLLDRTLTSYIVKRGNGGEIRQMYDTRRLDRVCSIKNFVALASEDNPIKSDEDMVKLYQETIILKLRPYIDESPIVVSGDFYVWMGTHKFLTGSAEGQQHSGKFLDWPGSFHIALNMQEAAYKHWFPLLKILYKAAFPGLVCPQVNLRPIQRVLLLSLALQAWQLAHTPTSTAPMAHDYSWGGNVIRTFFKEHLPLMLDAPVIITSLNYDHFEEFLVCRLLFFIQMGKQNYVTIILCILGRMGFYRAHNIPLYKWIQNNFRYLSEEAIELWHSVIRPLIHPTMQQNQAEQRVMFKAALQEADAQEAAVLNLRQGKLQGANAGTLLFQFRKDQECNLQAAADKLLSILDQIIVYNRDHGGPAYERESRTAGKNPVTTRLYRFTTEPDGLLLGEAVIPLTQRRPNAQGHTVVK